MANPSDSLPPFIDLAIIGAGPQSLTLTTHLLQKRPSLRHKLKIFDPSGTWLSQWRHQMAAQEILHLRSPAVHHPDPDPFALRRFAETRPHELFPPYDLPGTQLFEDFCLETIRRWKLTDAVYPAAVAQILPLSSRSRPRFQLVLKEGSSLIARRVVVASGGGIAQWPDWVNSIPSPYPRDRLSHAQTIDLRPLQLPGERILIVGGGLTSGHLALGAIARGATVTLMARRTVQEKLFDAAPGWLGPKYLKDFSREPDWNRRAAIVGEARNGGSITPAIMLQLRRAAREGTVTFREGCEVTEACWQSSRWRVKCTDGEVRECDRLWLATGTRLDARQDPLFQDIFNTYKTPIVKGFPQLDEYLRIPGCECFVMGGLAALQVGPVARNLAGARMASDRIVPALVKPSLMPTYFTAPTPSIFPP